MTEASVHEQHEKIADCTRNMDTLQSCPRRNVPLLFKLNTTQSSKSKKKAIQTDNEVFSTI